MRSPSTNTNASRSNIQVLASTLGRPQVQPQAAAAYPVEEADPRAPTDTPHSTDDDDGHFSVDGAMPTSGSLPQQQYPRPTLPPPLPPIQPRTAVPVASSAVSDKSNPNEASTSAPSAGLPTARDAPRPVYYPRRSSSTPPPASPPSAKAKIENVENPVHAVPQPLSTTPHPVSHNEEEEEEEGEEEEATHDEESIFSEPEERRQVPSSQRPTLPMVTTPAASAPSPLGRPPLSASAMKPNANQSMNTPYSHLSRTSIPASTPGAAANPSTASAGATPNKESTSNNNNNNNSSALATSQPAASSTTKMRGKPMVRRASSIANSASEVSITSSGHVRESATSKAKKKQQQKQREESPEVEELIPIATTQPLEKFFVQFSERKLKATNAGQEDGDSMDGGAAAAANVARDEDELLLEQFAEYTDDDTYFSSGSTVIETDPQRMAADPSRGRAVKSVHETLQLRALTDGRVPQDEEWNSANKTKWIYQIHYRDLALQHSSFFVFPAKWMPRVVVYNVMHHWLMEMFIFLMILGYSIFQATWGRYTAPRGEMIKPDHMIFADVFYTVLLGFEVLARLFASGFIMHERAFLRSPWHWLDVACLVLQIMACTWWQYLWNFTAWRLIRGIKCLSYVPAPVRMKLLAKSLLRSTNRVITVCLLILYFVFFFGLIGLQLFNGEMRSRCVNSITGAVTDQICRPSSSGRYWFYWGHHCEGVYTCVADQFHNKHFDLSSFDDIGHAMLSTFQIMTFQGWTSLMNETSDGLTLMAFLYYAITILICTWIIPSLFLGVFVEKIEKTSRLYVLQQLGFFDEMLKEQRQRLSASVRLGDFVERDEDGNVPHYPSAYHKVSKHDDSDESSQSRLTGSGGGGDDGVSDSQDSDDNGGKRKKKNGQASSDNTRHASLSAMEWTDEQRIQLQLSLTRQFDVAQDAERKRRMQKADLTDQILESGEGNAATTQQQQRRRRQAKQSGSQPQHQPRDGDKATTTKPNQFALGGRVGDVQHHPSSFTIGASRQNDLPFAVRQEFEAENLRFLDPYNNNNNNRANLNASDTFGPGASQAALPPLAPANTTTNNSRISQSRTIGGGGGGGVGASMTSVMATREVAGVVPSTAAMTSSMPLSRMNSSMTGGTAAAGAPPPLSRAPSASAVAMAPVDPVHSAERLELVVHDPEGGDFDYADGCCEKFGIIRNICHMFTEGYPRIITQYLWEHRVMQWRYGLGPLSYTNKYEEAALRKLRARRASEREEEREDMRRHGQSVPEDEVDGQTLERTNYGTTTQWMREEGLVAGGMAPLRMARNIRENAPITVFNYIMFFFILANAVFNASRFDTMPDYWEMGTFVAGVCFSVLFMLELLIRMVALGPGPFFFDFFNVVELVFMVISLFQLGFSRANTISLFNWIRFLKLFRVIPVRPLRRVCRVLIHGFPDMVYALIFFNLYMFMWVLIGMSFFGSRMGWVQYPETSEDYTRGTFVTFSHAVYAVAQAFSVNRDQWRLLSWQGMRVRGGYTIMYFIATVLVAFIFRYFFIAVMTYSWQSQEEEEDYDFMSSSSTGGSRAGGAPGARRLRWFDFTVWRSFKHLHGGFDRRDVSPDEVYFINEDMRRQLRLVESKEANYRRMYETAAGPSSSSQQQQGPDGVIEAGESAAMPQYVNVGGQLYRQPNSGPDPASDTTVAAVAAEKAQLRFARQQRTVPANMAAGGGERRVSPSPQNNNNNVNDASVFSEQGQRSMINPLVADRHSLSPARFGPASVAGRDASVTMLSTMNQSQSRQANNNNNMTAGTYSAEPAPSMSAQLLRLGRQKSSSRGGAGTDGQPQQQQTMEVGDDLQDGEIAMEHVLLAGPRLRYKSVLDGGRRVFDVCLDCNTHTQMPLRAIAGVGQRTPEELHAEHCHMSAVRSARQLVLNALVGYARLQSEHETTPTKRAMETVLGQAWSCGMLLFETVEHLTGVELPESERTWDRLMDALELQQWLLGLHTGEEQVGRATLAYVLASQQKQETKAREATFKESWQDYTFFCLSPSNPVRKACTFVTDAWWFELIILIVIYAASICLAVYAPGDNNLDMGGSHNGGKYKALHVLDDIFTVIFTVEMVLKWIVMGVLFPVKKAYFWHLWNIFDCFIVIISLVSWGHATTYLRYLKVMRCFRILKPARHWQWNRSLSSVALAVWDSIPTLANVCLIMLMNYIVWSIIFVSMFMNKMNRCSDGVTNNRTACLQRSYVWQPADRNFRNFYESLLTTVEISTGAEWLDVMYNAVDSWSTLHFPIRNRHPYLGLVFVIYYYLSHFVLFSLFISAVIYCYLLARNASQGAVGISFEHQLWLRMQEIILRIKPKAQLRPLNNGFSRALHKVVSATWFEIVMAVILVCNMITMALEWYHMDSKQELALNILQWIFVALFTIEVILRLAAHGLRFFSRWAYCWDLFVCVLSFIQIGCNTTDNHQVPFNMNVLRMLRVGRVLTLVNCMTPFETHLSLFHEVILASVPGFISVTLLYMIAVYVFAILGLHFLGYIVPFGGYIDSKYNNFHTFVNALIMVFRLSTLENWATMLRGSLSRSPDSNYCNKAHGRCGPTNWAPVYYIPIVICFFLIISTLYMAVVLDHYISAIRLRHSVGRLHDLRRFCELWSARDPNNTEVLKTSELVDILEELRPPLGLVNRHDRAELLRLLGDYDITDHNGRVHYDEVLMPMARRVMAMAFHQAGEEEEDAGASARAYELAWRLSEQSLGAMAITGASTPDSSSSRAAQAGPRRTVAEHYAATYLQAAYKRDRARRDMYILKSGLWAKGRRACDEQALPYDQYGFGSVGLAYTDPSDEGRALGFYIPANAKPTTTATTRDRTVPLFERTAQRQGLANDADAASSRSSSTPGDHAGAPATILPLKYVSAIGQPAEKRFGPDVPDAIKRYERRSDKLDRRNSTEDEQSGGDEENDYNGNVRAPAERGPGANSRTNNNNDVSASAFHTDRMDASYQPPLGTDPEVMREEERQRRLERSGAVGASTPSRLARD